ncbi:hypothetical protein AB0T83_19275, partial [Fluviibacterium sp. DFM31]
MVFRGLNQSENTFQKNFTARSARLWWVQRRKETPMSFQNPVFIPGPTNIPESLRKACDMPTI